MRNALLLETLGTLEMVVRDARPPAAAREAIRSLGQRFADAQIDLVWEEQAYDQSLHYDALIRERGNGTIALSYCPDRVVPWPLRGAQAAGDEFLLRVDRTYMRVDQAMACIDFIWNQANVLERLIDVCLMQQTLEEDPIELSDSELQAAMDAFRRGHHLYSAAATHAWLRQRGLTPLQLEEKVHDQAVMVRLRERLTGDKIGQYFEEHRAEFDRVRVVLLGLKDPDVATALLHRIHRGEVSFYEAAEAAAGEVEMRLETWVRRAAPAELVDQVFGAAAGDVLGPLSDQSETALVRLLRREPARLDTATAAAIADVLMRAWLDARRDEVSVEWYWGNHRPNLRTDVRNQA